MRLHPAAAAFSQGFPTVQSLVSEDRAASGLPTYNACSVTGSHAQQVAATSAPQAQAVSTKQHSDHNALLHATLYKRLSHAWHAPSKLKATPVCCIAGNQALQVSRKVFVRDPCPPPEATCRSTKRCSILGSCQPQVLAALSAFSQQALQLPATAKAVTVDTVAPVITLRGVGTWSTSADGNTILLQTAVVGARFQDPGADAVDDVEGNISSRVVVNGPRVTTAAPTVSPAYFELRYSVADWAGNAARPSYRRVAVVCPAGEVICASSTPPYYCSTAGLCLPPLEGA